MEKVDFDIFDNLLKKAVVYLEYGSGGSTIHALKTKVPIVYSVENDSEWETNVKGLASRLDLSKQVFEMCFTDMSPMSRWGTPLVVNLDLSTKYVKDVWDLCTLSKRLPNVVLIDGRFRVACFIQTLIKLNNTRSTIIFDDYSARKHYKIFESIIKPSRMGSRAAIFEDIKLSEDQIKSLKRSQETYFGDLR